MELCIHRRTIVVASHILCFGVPAGVHRRSPATEIVFVRLKEHLNSNTKKKKPAIFIADLFGHIFTHKFSDKTFNKEIV